jgi:hypothetical protein
MLGRRSRHPFCVTSRSIASDEQGSVRNRIVTWSVTETGILLWHAARADPALARSASPSRQLLLGTFEPAS